MRKIFAIWVVFATVTAAVFAVSDDQAKFYSSTAEQAVDSELILEDWMLVSAFESAVTEAGIDLEDWMIDTDSFAEERVELEDWMLKDYTSENTTEDDLVLENWMFIFS
jgi:hypothetical protein